MGYLIERSNIRTLRPGDPMFRIVGNITTVNRAGFEIDKACPLGDILVIQRAVDRGWLNPVAYVRDDELFWDKIKG